jgi:[CysO sulfur-carrier protein]-S-L-cysteine hydrolase
MVDEAHLSLPRSLINELLHAAQLSPSHLHWGIISGHDGEPEHCQGIPRYKLQTINSVRETLSQRREQIWGLYCSTPEDIELPNSNELAQMGIPRFLGISIGTKGVLQIRGWRLDGDDLREQEVTIQED